MKPWSQQGKQTAVFHSLIPDIVQIYSLWALCKPLGSVLLLINTGVQTVQCLFSRKKPQISQGTQTFVDWNLTCFWQMSSPRHLAFESLLLTSHVSSHNWSRFSPCPAASEPGNARTPWCPLLNPKQTDASSVLLVPCVIHHYASGTV